MKRNKILISGASFAGLTTAYWMNKMGYDVTIVEKAGSVKKGGTPVDIKGVTVEIVRRMGLFEQIKSRRIGPEKWEFKNADDVTELELVLKQPGEDLPDDEFEIERDVLLDMLFDLVRDDVNIFFERSIVTMEEREEAMDVRFSDNSHDSYQMVFGCDGVHSSVRKIWFGDESKYVEHMGPYFAVAVVNNLLVSEGTYQMYAEPGKSLALYAYNKKTDIIFTFRSDENFAYNFRNPQQHKQLVAEQLTGMKWRAPKLKAQLLNAGSFYFDKFCQVKMPFWTKGRVALVGDAGYCASPAAGMGGSLAIIGATALADAFSDQHKEFESAFRTYESSLRPFVEELQAAAVKMLQQLLPATQEEINRRNRHGFSE